MKIYIVSYIAIEIMYLNCGLNYKRKSGKMIWYVKKTRQQIKPILKLSIDFNMLTQTKKSNHDRLMHDFFVRSYSTLYLAFKGIYPL